MGWQRDKDMQCCRKIGEDVSHNWCLYVYKSVFICICTVNMHVFVNVKMYSWTFTWRRMYPRLHVCDCTSVCTYRRTVCCLVGDTVRIQADYRGEIRSLRHTDPVFYSWKTGGYMSEQDEKAPCFVSCKKSRRSVSTEMGRACWNETLHTVCVTFNYVVEAKVEQADCSNREKCLYKIKFKVSPHT